MRMFRVATTFAILTVAGSTLTACSDSDAGTLTEHSVRSVVTSVEAAKKQGDFGKAASYLSSDCVVQGGPHSCQEMFDSENKAKDQGTNRQFESTTPTITIENGKAHARLTETITLVAYDKTWAKISNVDDTLEVRGGHVLITDIHGTSSMTADGHSVQ